MPFKSIFQPKVLAIIFAVLIAVNPYSNLDLGLIVIFLTLVGHFILKEKLLLAFLLVRPALDYWRDLTIFQYQDMIPPYFLQISVGIYLIEIIFILTSTLVTINSGEDKLEMTNKVGINLKKGMSLYFIVALLSVVALSILSATVLGNLLG